VPPPNQIKKTAIDISRLSRVPSRGRLPKQLQASLAVARQARAKLGKNSYTTADEFNISEPAEFYMIFLACLAKGGFVMDKRWLHDKPKPYEFFNRLCDLDIRLRVWCEDMFGLELREDSWEKNEVFPQSTLCRVVLRCLSALRIELGSIADFLSTISRRCAAFDRRVITFRTVYKSGVLRHARLWSSWYADYF
jgi:hypothetical protein